MSEQVRQLATIYIVTVPISTFGLPDLGFFSSFLKWQINKFTIYSALTKQGVIRISLNAAVQ